MMGIQFEAYLRAAERGDNGGRIGALKAMLGITHADIDPVKKALSLVRPEKLWRCKIDPAQDYASSLQRERVMLQQAVHLCAFSGFHADEHERATACAIRVLLLELMPEQLRQAAKSAPKHWSPRTYEAARVMFELMLPDKFNISDVSAPGVGITRTGLGAMIEEALNTVMCGGF